MLFFAHSGLRYLVLLAGFVALIYYLYAVLTKQERSARAFGSIFVGLLDLQIVLGILLVAMGVFYSALIGHMFMMIAAAVVAHAALALSKGAPQAGRANAMRLVGVAVALILIIGGIMAIGRPIFGAGSPTLL